MMGTTSAILRDLADLLDRGCGVSAEEFEKISTELNETKSDIEDLKAVAGMLSKRLNALERSGKSVKIIKMKIDADK